MVLLLLWLKGLALGLGAAAPIGPVNVEIARRTLRFGRSAGFLLGCGAVTIDVGYAILTSAASLTLRRVYETRWLTVALNVAAALFLGYLAYLCLKSALVGHRTTEDAAAPVAEMPRSRRSHYATGLLITALNPMTLAFWFVAVPGAVGEAARDSRAGLPMVCAGVFLGAFSWVCGFTWVVGHLKTFGGQRWLRWIDFAGGVLLLAFALGAIWRLAASTL
jgi:threonine/homoserine/homoserine lactone efflux protein